MTLESDILAALREVLDPEIGLDVVSLGLVYEIRVDEAAVRVELGMTTPTCPLGEQLVRDAEERLAPVVGRRSLRVELVSTPPWTPERMSPEARAELGWRR